MPAARRKASSKRPKARRRLADSKGPNSKLKVTFFWPFYGDYWILDLDPDYRWAMVGTPDRKYLWLLSRTPQIGEDLYRKLVEDADGEGLRYGSADPHQAQFALTHSGSVASAFCSSSADRIFTSAVSDAPSSTSTALPKAARALPMSGEIPIEDDPRATR